MVDNGAASSPRLANWADRKSLYNTPPAADRALRANFRCAATGLSPGPRPCPRRPRRPHRRSAPRTLFSMAEPRRRARRGDGGRAFQEVLSHARSLLEPIASTRKGLRIRSVREAGVLLANWWASLQIGGRPACKLVGLESSWRARALSASNLQRLHSVVAELSEALGRAVPPPPPPRLAAGEGGETSEDEDAEA